MSTLKKIARIFFGVIVFLLGIVFVIIPIIDESTGEVTTPWWLILLFVIIGVLLLIIGWRLIMRKWPLD